MPTDSNNMMQMQMQGNEIVLYQPNDAKHLEVKIVQNEGRRKVTRMVEFYNQDMILSVGSRNDSIH